MPSLANLTDPNAVLAAIHEYDQLGGEGFLAKYGFGPARTYLLRHNVSVGSVNETTCHPREVLRPVLVAAGHGFVVAHNHPSGDASPSAADREATGRRRDAAALMQVRFVDHVIVGANTRHFSFREAGIL